MHLNGFLTLLKLLDNLVARRLVSSSADEETLEAAAGRTQKWRIDIIVLRGESGLNWRGY